MADENYEKGRRNGIREGKTEASMTGLADTIDYLRRDVTELKRDFKAYVSNDSKRCEGHREAIHTRINWLIAIFISLLLALVGTLLGLAT